MEKPRFYYFSSHWNNYFNHFSKKSGHFILVIRTSSTNISIILEMAVYLFLIWRNGSELICTVTWSGAHPCENWPTWLYLHQNLTILIGDF